MSSRLLYQDRVVALTSEALVVRGFTKFLGRPRRIALSDIASFRMRDRSEFPHEQLPNWGVDDEGVWYTRDRHRYRHHTAIEITFATGVRVGFSPAHASRVRDLLLHQGVSEQ